MACGGWHTAVIGENGGVWMCGRGEFGRLGLGDQKSQVSGSFGLGWGVGLNLGHRDSAFYL